MARKEIEIICSYCGKKKMSRTKLKKHNYCDTICYNKHTKKKKINGYKRCLECEYEFPYRNSLKSRSIGVPRKNGVASVNTKFCCNKCKMSYQNRENNPMVHKENRDKISGRNNYNWQGGITPENKRLRNTFEQQQWRRNVFERDDYTCQLCFERGGFLNADHIKPFALFPELRLDLNNGRTLCYDCHKNTDTWGGRTRKHTN